METEAISNLIKTGYFKLKIFYIAFNSIFYHVSTQNFKYNKLKLLL